MRRARECVISVLMMVAVSCAPDPSPEQLRAQFAEAERLCLEGEFQNAKVLLKDYLIHDPEHAGAHYYLARTFMLSQDFRPIMAEGEFQTALRLFVRQGRTSPIDRFSAEYFEMMCYLDSARVIHVQCDAAFNAGAPPNVLRQPLERALDFVAKARTVMPTAAEVDQIGDPIRELAAQTRTNEPAND